MHWQDKVLDNVKEIEGRIVLVRNRGRGVQPIDEDSVCVIMQEQAPGHGQPTIPNWVLCVEITHQDGESPPHRQTGPTRGIGSVSGRQSQFSLGCLPTLDVWWWLAGAADLRQAQCSDLCPADKDHCAYIPSLIVCPVANAVCKL